MSDGPSHSSRPDVINDVRVVAGLAPWLAGYEMAADDLAIISFTRTLDGSYVLGPSATLSCDSLGHDFDTVVDQTVKDLTRTLGPEQQFALYIVGHGRAGDLFSTRARAGLQSNLPEGTYLFPVHNTGRAILVQTPGAPGWVDYGRPLDVTEKATALGLRPPMADRAMKDRLWDPDPVPSFQPVTEREHEGLAGIVPTHRARAAVDLLRELSTGNAADPETSQTRLAALLHTDPTGHVHARLIQTAAAGDAPQMAETLRQLYVASPEIYRPAAGTVAAVADWQIHGATRPLDAVRTQVSDDSRQARMLDLMRAMRPDPKVFRDIMAENDRAADQPGAHAEVLTKWAESQQDHTRPQLPPTDQSPKGPPPAPRPEDLPPTAGPGGPSMN